jgi:DNA polymerase-3 subunit epsilon
MKIVKIIAWVLGIGFAYTSSGVSLVLPVLYDLWERRKTKQEKERSLINQQQSMETAPARAADWARSILEHKDEHVVIDIETTGLSEKDAIVALAMTDMDGAEIFNSLIRPSQRKRMSKEVVEIHGIKMSMLRDQPMLIDVIEELDRAVGEKTVLMYNEEFISRMIEQSLEQDGTYKTPNWNRIDVMTYYSAFKGEYSEYHGDFRRQRLPGNNHDPLNDCRAVVKLVARMAVVKNRATVPREKM